MKCACIKSLYMAGLLALTSLVQTPQALALTYVDNFGSGAINPAWWTVGATGGSVINAANQRIELTQGASGGAGLTVAFPIVGDFSVTVDYTLLNWPSNNMERLSLVAYAGPTNQLAVERVSDRQYDPQSIGEIYLTDFPGQGILGTPTSDGSGTLRLERLGDTVKGAYWSGSDWAVIGTHHAANEGNVSRLIGVGIWPASPFSPGVKVAIDNFALVAPAAPIPEVETYVMLLSGLTAIAFWRRRRRRIYAPC